MFEKVLKKDKKGFKLFDQVVFKEYPQHINFWLVLQTFDYWVSNEFQIQIMYNWS